MTDRIRDFLTRHGLLDDHMENRIPDILDKAWAGLAGKSSSLAMIPSFVTTKGRITPGRRILVIDAGGTNLRIAKAHLSDAGQCVIDRMDSYAMIGSKEEVDVRDFFDTLAGYVLPVLSSGNDGDACGCAGICFVFSFPFAALPDGDGRILMMDKEVKIKDAPGKLLGQGLTAALKARGLSQVPPVMVINDTVSTLMGGMPESIRRGCDSCIGFILGTGINAACLIDCRHILKEPQLCSLDHPMVINTELGNYDGFLRGDYDRMLDEASEAPGKMLYEKSASGAYLGRIVLQALKGAAKEGIFTEESCRRLFALEDLESKDADDYLRIMLTGEPSEQAEKADEPFGVSEKTEKVDEQFCASGKTEKADVLFCASETAENADEEGKKSSSILYQLMAPCDRKEAAGIIEAVFDRAAHETACMLAAVMLLVSGREASVRESADHSGIRDIRAAEKISSGRFCIAADGSTFYKTLLMKPRVTEYLDRLAEQYGFSYCFTENPDGNIGGGTAAALLNL